MPIPIDARPMTHSVTGDVVPGHTTVILDDGTEMSTPDPDGSFLAEAKSIAEMRGQGGLGSDQRIALGPVGVQPARADTAPATNAPALGGRSGAPGQAWPVAAPNASAPVGTGRPGHQGVPMAPTVAPAPAPITSTEDSDTEGPSDGGGYASESPEFVIVPGSPGGWRKSSRQTQGYAPEDKKDIQESDEDLQKRFNESSVERERAGNELAARQRAEALTSLQKVNVQQSAEEQAKREKETKLTENLAEVNRWQSAQPKSLWGNAVFAISAFLGQAVNNIRIGISDTYSKEDHARRVAQADLANIDKMVKDDIDRQAATNTGFLAAAKTKYNDTYTALEVTRQNIKELAAKEATAMAGLAKSDETKLYYKIMADDLQLKASEHGANAARSRADQQTLAEQNVPGTAAQAVNLTEAQITQTLGGGDKKTGLKRWNDAMTAKVGGGDGANTVNQTLGTIMQVNQDVSFMEALAKSNGGTIPTTGIVEIPNAWAGFASKLGIQKGSTAENINIILNGYVNQKARAFGGAITDSDRESALKEMGTSTQGKLFAMRRLRDIANNNVRTALAASVPGYEQSTLDLYLGRVNKTPGVRAAPSLRPRGAPQERAPQSNAAPTQTDEFDTPLEPAEETQFKAWKNRYAPRDSGADYDLRGAFKADLEPGADGHWPDTFKKPNHPTFSNQSIYARGKNKARAGHWEGDTYVPPKSR